MKQLHNIYGRAELLKMREAEKFKRKTVSFYRYVIIEEPAMLRDKLYEDWSNMGVL